MVQQPVCLGNHIQASGGAGMSKEVSHSLIEFESEFINGLVRANCACGWSSQWAGDMEKAQQLYNWHKQESSWKPECVA